MASQIDRSGGALRPLAGRQDPRAHIRWRDDQGTEIFCVAMTEASALEKLAEIEGEPELRRVSCVVK